MRAGPARQSYLRCEELGSEELKALRYIIRFTQLLALFTVHVPASSLFPPCSLVVCQPIPGRLPKGFHKHTSLCSPHNLGLLARTSCDALQ